MLRGEGLVKRFATGTVAVPGATIAVRPGVRLGLLGPSGCGKSTLAAMLALLVAPDEGQVSVDGQPVTRFGVRAPAALRRRVQLLWQSPVAAADPRMRIRELVTEPARIAREDPAAVLADLAPRVGLSPELLDRFPHEVSAGQLQRACIARALACRPRYLVADEPTAMFDVSTQAGLLRTLADTATEDGLGLVLITHDTALAQHWCDEVVEFGDLVAQV